MLQRCWGAGRLGVLLAASVHELSAVDGDCRSGLLEALVTPQTQGELIYDELDVARDGLDDGVGVELEVERNTRRGASDDRRRYRQGEAGHAKILEHLVGDLVGDENRLDDLAGVFVERSAQQEDRTELFYIETAGGGHNMPFCSDSGQNPMIVA